MGVGMGVGVSAGGQLGRRGCCRRPGGRSVCVEQETYSQLVAPPSFSRAASLPGTPAGALPAPPPPATPLPSPTCSPPQTARSSASACPGAPAPRRSARCGWGTRCRTCRPPGLGGGGGAGGEQGGRGAREVQSADQHHAAGHTLSCMSAPRAGAVVGRKGMGGTMNQWAIPLIKEAQLYERVQIATAAGTQYGWVQGSACPRADKPAGHVLGPPALMAGGGAGPRAVAASNLAPGAVARAPALDLSAAWVCVHGAEGMCACRVHGGACIYATTLRTRKPARRSEALNGLPVGARKSRRRPEPNKKLAPASSLGTGAAVPHLSR